MTLWSEDPTFGPADSPADYQSLSTGWALGDAAAAAWWDSPLAETLRMADQYEARHGKATRAGTYMFPAGAPPMLTAEQANDRYGIEGKLHWNESVRESEAKLLHQWKLDEIARDDRLSRATKGFVPATARFLTGLAVSAIDPINVAASFIPVFGEARWAALAGRIGMRSTRLVRGAAEGFVGSAAVEPITYFQQRNQQADYTALDSVMNVAMGTIAGPALHVGAGVIDKVIHARWAEAPIALRDEAFAHTAAALTEGTPVRAAELLGTQEAAHVGSPVPESSSFSLKDHQRPEVAHLGLVDAIRATIDSSLDWLDNAPEDYLVKFRTGWGGGERAQNVIGRNVHEMFKDWARVNLPHWDGNVQEAGGSLRPDFQIGEDSTGVALQVELKPKTKSGSRKGAKQTSNYRSTLGTRVEVIYYDFTPAQIEKLKALTAKIKDIQSRRPEAAPKYVPSPKRKPKTQSLPGP